MFGMFEISHISTSCFSILSDEELPGALGARPRLLWATRNSVRPQQPPSWTCLPPVTPPACSFQSDICERVPTFQTRDFQLFPSGFQGHFLTASTLGSSRRNLEQEMIKYFSIFLQKNCHKADISDLIVRSEVRCVHNMVQAGGRCWTRNNSFSVTVTRAKLSHSQTLVHLLTTK